MKARRPPNALGSADFSAGPQSPADRNPRGRRAEGFEPMQVPSQSWRELRGAEGTLIAERPRTGGGWLLLPTYA
jgi:hypothetical protein